MVLPSSYEGVPSPLLKGQALLPLLQELRSAQVWVSCYFPCSKVGYATLRFFDFPG